MATSGDGPTRSEFLQDLFQKNPDVNEKAAAQAWAAAGNEGTISPSSFYKAKKEFLGEAAPTAAPRRPKAKSAKGPKAKPASPPVVKDEPAASTPVKTGTAGGRERVLDQEDSIDDLIVELKQLGGTEEALEAIRKARRVIVRSHQG